MRVKQTAADIDRIAADWVVREDRRALSPAEQVEHRPGRLRPNVSALAARVLR